MNHSPHSIFNVQAISLPLCLTGLALFTDYMRVTSLQSNLFLAGGIASIVYDCTIHKSDHSYIVSLAGRMALAVIFSVVTLTLTSRGGLFAMIHSVKPIVLTSLSEMGTISIVTYFVKPIPLRLPYLNIRIKRRRRGIREPIEVKSIARKSKEGLKEEESARDLTKTTGTEMDTNMAETALGRERAIKSATEELEEEEWVAAMSRATEEERAATCYTENAIWAMMKIRESETTTRKIAGTLKDSVVGGSRETGDRGKKAKKAEKALGAIRKVAREAEEVKYQAEVALQKLQEITTRIEQSMERDMAEEAKMMAMEEVKNVEIITQGIKENSEIVMSKKMEAEIIEKSAQNNLTQAMQLELKNCDRQIN